MRSPVWTMAIAALVASPVMSRTLEVGSGKAFATLPAAAAAAVDGDIVIVYPGTYTSGALWKQNNLTIARAPGTPANSAVVTDGTVGGKGLFVTTGANIVIDGLRFQNARVPDGNGAGIRAEGLNLTVRNSSFFNNENGILATPLSGRGTLSVLNSNFDYTHSNTSTAHSLYANGMDKLIVQGSTFTRNFVGHYVKSRALNTVVTNNRIDDTNGTGSYLIELAEGGAGNIAGNTLVKGANARNCCIAIAYGFEMSKGGAFANPAGPVLIERNNFTNKRASTVYFAYNKSVPTNPITLKDNVLTALAGRIIPLAGAGTVTTSTTQQWDTDQSGINNQNYANFAMTPMMNLLVSDPQQVVSPQSTRADAAFAAANDIPEPGMFAILGAGLAMLGLVRYRRTSTWRRR